MSINRQIAELKRQLDALDDERKRISDRIAELEDLREKPITPPGQSRCGTIAMTSATNVKIELFRNLFRGREDVYPRRWENAKTKKAGYSPVCRNEWVRGICGKPKVKCGECPSQAFQPITDETLRAHLQGRDRGTSSDFTVGVYPMLLDETCRFLAVDFDKQSWMSDVAAFRDTARLEGVPLSVERSRSGNGAHAWVFFAESVPAAEARRLGAFLLTATMDRYPDIGFSSYDRLFPSQDNMPSGGFGNLIALPLQAKPRENGNSVFVDDNFHPFPDQWAYLSSVSRMTS